MCFASRCQNLVSVKTRQRRCCVRCPKWFASCVSVDPPSCQSCVRGWNRRRPTDRNCRRSCARSGRPERTWSAQSAISGSRWPSPAWWEAAPLRRSPLPRDPRTSTPHPPPPLPLSRRPRLAPSNWHPLELRRPLPQSPPSAPSHPPTRQRQSSHSEGPPSISSCCFLFFFNCTFPDVSAQD